MTGIQISIVIFVMALAAIVTVVRLKPRLRWRPTPQQNAGGAQNQPNPNPARRFYHATFWQNRFVKWPTIVVVLVGLWVILNQQPVPTSTAVPLSQPTGTGPVLIKRDGNFQEMPPVPPDATFTCAVHPDRAKLLLTAPDGKIYTIGAGYPPDEMLRVNISYRTRGGYQAMIHPETPKDITTATLELKWGRGWGM